MDLPPRAFRCLVYGLFLLSGATALVYETVWARSLTLVFGATHEAVSIVLAAFMGGLALGGAVIGRLVRRMSRPLLAYGVLEVAIALSALAVPAALRLVDRIYVSTALGVSGQPWELQLLRAGLAAAVLLVPTFLMGGTLPILVGLLVGRASGLGRNLSLLYGINTAGAVVGIAAAGFVLLPSLGMRRTTLVAVALNLGIGVAAMAVDGLRRKRRAVQPGAVPASGSDASDAAGEPLEHPPSPEQRPALRLAFFGTAVCGFGALALEVLWMRGITLAVGNTAYSFAVMLAAFLVGIALGAYLHALLPLQRLGDAEQFALLLVVLGVASAAVSQSFPHLPRLAVTLNALLYDDPSGVRAAATLILSFAVMLVPATLLGIAFPLAGEAGARLGVDFARSVGNLVAINTTGAIAGSLAAGYLLIPAVGQQRGMLLMAALLASYGVAVGASALAGRRLVRRSIGRLGALAAALALLLAALRLPAWDLHLLSVFRNNQMGSYMEGGGVEALRKLAEQSTVFYYREGKGSNVTVLEGPRARSLAIDGKTVATDGLSDMQHELLLGHIPVLAHPEPRRAAVVGLGAGITLGAVLAHRELESVTVVELEPAVVDAARLFAHVNDGAVDDPRLEIVLQDGRNYLLTTRGSFDVITADPIHPWARGAAYLYTREYYRLARGRLAPGGVMCQWLPLYELSLANIRSAVATFGDVFEHATLWRTAMDAILIGSTRPLELEVEQLQRRLAQPAVARQLRQIGLGDAASFLAELVLDEDSFRAFGEGAIRNTDDNLYLEFSSPLAISRNEVVRINDALEEAGVSFHSVLGPASRSLPGLAQTAEAFREAKRATIGLQLRLQAADAGSSPADYDSVIRDLFEVVAAHPAYGRSRSLLTEAWVGRGVKHYLLGDNDQALAAVGQALSVSPASATANHYLGTFLSEAGRLAEAIPYFETSIAERPSSRTHLNHGVTLLRLGRPAAAAIELERAAGLRPGDARSHHMLATALAELGRSAEARRNFELALRLKPDLPGARLNYATHLAGAGDYRQALDVLAGAGGAEQIAAARLEAWILATAPSETLRDPARALALAEGVDRATGGRIPICLDTYAAALAAAGRFEEAVAIAERGRALAEEQEQAELAAAIDERLALYESGRPYRQPR